MTKTKLFGAAAVPLLLVASMFTSTAWGQAMTLQSATRYMDLTSKYHLEYFTHNEGGVIKIRFTLTLEDVDITNWKTQGQDGIWLGIGYGKSVMDGADIVQCEFKYTNNPTVDKFNCNDRYGVAKNAPIFDSIRNTIDISS